MKTTLILILLLLFCPVLAVEYTVSEILDLALSHAAPVRMKEKEVLKSGYALEEARARLWPELDLQASFTLMSHPPEGITIEKGGLGYAPSPQSEFPVPFPDQSYTILDDTEPTYFKITATATQPIFTWHKIRNAIHISELELDISRLSLDKAKQELRKEVSVLYFSVVLAGETQIVLEKSKKVLAEILTDRESSFTEGYINRQEVLGARKNLAAMEKAVIQAEESLLSGLAGLAHYTGLPEDSMQLSSTFYRELPEIDEEQASLATIENSPALAVMAKQVQQAETLLAIEQGGSLLKPDISLVASMDITGQEIPLAGGNWTDTWNENFTLTLAGKVKLFDAGKAQARVSAAREQAEIAAMGLEEMRKGLQLQVRKAVADVKTGYYTVLEKLAALEEAEETYKNARVSFENELITREEERGAHVLLYASEMEYLLARFNYEIALTELEYLGGLTISSREK